MQLISLAEGVKIQKCRSVVGVLLDRPPMNNYNWKIFNERNNQNGI